MKQTLRLTLGGATLWLLSSCGTGKKLEQTTAALNQLQTDYAKQTEMIASLNGEVGQLKKENMTYATEMQQCREAKEALQSNLTAMNKALGEQGTSFRQIYQKAEAALLKFEDAGVKVEYRNGLIYLRLADELMFTSGSANLGWEGKQALQVVAEVLNENPGVIAYIIGNTDNQPVKSGSKDNWTLSTERANSIIRALVRDFEVNPARLISAGRASYHPVGDNNSSEGRSANRRTDIILNPNLDRLWEKK